MNLSKEKKLEVMQALSEKAQESAKSAVEIIVFAASTMDLVVLCLQQVADISYPYEIAAEEREELRYHYIKCFCDARISLLREYVPFLGMVFMQDRGTLTLEEHSKR